MDEAAVYTKLTEIFREVFDDEKIVLSPQLTASDNGDWDSLRHVRLLLTIEKGFGVKFATSEMIRMKNVGDLALLIRRKVSGAS